MVQSITRHSQGLGARDGLLWVHLKGGNRIEGFLGAAVEGKVEEGRVDAPNQPPEKRQCLWGLSSQTLLLCLSGILR